MGGGPCHVAEVTALCQRTAMALDKAKLCAALQKAIPKADPATTREVIEVIRAEEDLKVFTTASLQAMAIFASVSHESLADWLIHRGRVVGTEQAVSDLERYLEQEEIPIHVVAPLGGVVVEEVIDLGAAITLLPLDRVPESQAKAYFLERVRWPGHRVLWQFSSAYPALICPRFRDKGHPGGESWVRSDPRELGDIQELMRDVCRALTIVGPCAPICLGLWEQTEEWVPCGDRLYLDRWFWTWRDAEVAQPWRTFDDKSLAEAKDLFGCYMALAQETRQKLQIPIDRLNESMRRRTLEDRAIDLGISLESLFLRKRDHDKARKLSQRAAALLGGTADERRAFGELVYGIYKLRNGAVHEGKVDDQEAAGKLKRGWEIVAEALRKIIMLGKLPDWDQVTFG